MPRQSPPAIETMRRMLGKTAKPTPSPRLDHPATFADADLVPLHLQEAWRHLDDASDLIERAENLRDPELLDLAKRAEKSAAELLELYKTRAPLC